MRADLEMPDGKLSAQSGHAYTDALQACQRQAPDTAAAYREENGIGGSKVTIKCKNLSQLERAARECAEAGIPHAVVTDRDHILLPHFTGAPVVTALGIGPCTKAQCRHITKRFQSLQGSSGDRGAMSQEVRQELLSAMRGCEQTSGLTIMGHGGMVRDYYRDLLDHLRYGSELRFEWRLPEWIHNPRLVEGLPSDEVMAEYHVFHDVGKPFCRVVDDEGRQHFPDHAQVSARVWRQAGGSAEVEHLIEQDMDIHLLKAEGVQEFADRPYPAALLLTGLSELHANASMFGGIESTSFKIKYKNLSKRGRAILACLSAKEVVPMAA
ncbi:aminoacyl-tRNA hydrolase [Sphingomonas sp. 3-13AW]